MDFHGHSKKLNTFIYACMNEQIHKFRIYPYIYSKECPLFSIEDCTYNITIDKLRTARVNLFKSLKIPHIYTLETGFYGHSKVDDLIFRVKRIIDLFLMIFNRLDKVHHPLYLLY